VGRGVGVAVRFSGATGGGLGALPTYSSGTGMGAMGSGRRYVLQAPP
jgi:hypothetical protein